MGKRLMLVIPIIFLFSFSHNSGAHGEAIGTESTQWLYSQCTAGEGSIQRAFCIGYISSVLDFGVMEGQPDSTGRKVFGVCFEGVVSYGAAVQVFKNWAEKNPELWSIYRQFGVLLALQEKWPCK